MNSSKFGRILHRFRHYCITLCKNRWFQIPSCHLTSPYARNLRFFARSLRHIDSVYLRPINWWYRLFTIKVKIKANLSYRKSWMSVWMSRLQNGSRRSFWSRKFAIASSTRAAISSESTRRRGQQLRTFRRLRLGNLTLIDPLEWYRAVSLIFYAITAMVLHVISIA